MEAVLSGLIIIPLCLIVLAYISTWIAEAIWGEDIFEYSRNPFRRFCKKCGQQQDKHDWSWNNVLSYQTGWWEDAGVIVDATCECHKSQQYKSLI
jgi:hypothetical protein